MGVQAVKVRTAGLNKFKSIILINNTLNLRSRPGASLSLLTHRLSLSIQNLIFALDDLLSLLSDPSPFRLLDQPIKRNFAALLTGAWTFVIVAEQDVWFYADNRWRGVIHVLREDGEERFRKGGVVV